MCGLSLPLFLLLWILGATPASAKVTAPTSLTAEVGRPAHLYCNITASEDETVHQVRWVNSRSTTLLSYKPTPRVLISHQEDNVKLVAALKDFSHITIKRVGPDDDDCYTCVFDVYPSGKQESTTCIAVIGKVHLQGNRTAVSGRPVTLNCSYSLAERVLQVLWRKTAEQGDTTTVASYAEHGSHTEGQFKGRVRLSRTLGETRLTIERVRTEDEACYTCEFHTYPHGTRSATACLSVYVLPKPEVSYMKAPSGVTEVNCTAQSRPPATLLWDTGSENRTLGPPILSVYDQGDGTTVVTSTLLFQTALISEQAVKCVVQHPGLEKALTLPLKADVNPTKIVLISVCGVVAVLLLSLCVCLCKCFICTDD